LSGEKKEKNDNTKQKRY